MCLHFQKRESGQPTAFFQQPPKPMPRHNTGVMKNLILVAGHAVPYRFDRLDSDEGWYLKHFQAGEGGLYVEHVRRGVELAAADTESLLLFAGGQTDGLAGPRSEGQGYWLVAEYFRWFGHEEVSER